MKPRVQLSTLGRPSTLAQLSPPVRGLILDMDGVLWRDETPIGSLPAVFQEIAARGLKVAAATNNATRSVEQYLEKLKSFGVTLEPWQIVTSAEATTRTLAHRFTDKGRVFVVGENGLVESLNQGGFTVITDPEDPSDVVAVVGGFDRSLTYAKLSRAASHARNGIPFYGTNADLTFPTPHGLIPGAGSILAAISAASGVQPIVIGKPAPFLLELAAERLKLPKDVLLIVGDRLETDIAGGQAFGARTALVLSGVSSREQARSWKPQPDVIAEDLGQLVGAQEPPQ